MSGQKKSEKKGKTNRKVYVGLAIFIILVISATAYWYKLYTEYIKTDDAYIDADRVSLGSKILGRIVKLHVEEGDTVTSGELLIELDSSELKAQLFQTYAMKEQTEANLEQAKAKYNYDDMAISVQAISFQTAETDFKRAQIQHDGGVITEEQFEHIRKNYQTAQAQYDAAKLQLKVSASQVEISKAAVENTEAQINLILTQLKNTKIYSPLNGIVSRRWQLEGDIASPGQPVITITNENNKWVTAFIEETQLSHINLNQEAEFTVDAFPGKIFHGNVFYIGANTAGQFSLIPPNNASGNFTKVTQRVPLKISIREVDHDSKDPVNLISGMSVILKIIR